MNTQQNSSVRRIARALILIMVFPSLPVWAAPPVVVATGSGNTTTTTASNGVTVVNINTPNGAGLSHNKYTDYNVPLNGLVLNNGSISQLSRQSQLAGQVPANQNLTTAARTILNEVVSTNRSLLQGFTEVLGGRADVVVANPNGITCAGCGFINTDRVSLVTGTPNLAADGSLRDFSVNRGDILINGAGLNGSAQQYLDLVSRSVRIDGQINVPMLRITTGNNVWNFASALVTGATTPDGTAPAYAFDSTVLGGMYANRIRIVATEAGVGVRMQGEAAASGDDFSINAAGKIDIRSKISAERDLSLTTTATGGDAIVLSDASLSARRNLDLSASNGGASLSGGVLVAGNNLTANLGTLNDSASTAAIADNNKRYAGGTMSLALSGAANLNGVSYSAGGAFSATAERLTVGADGVLLAAGGSLNLRATTGDLALANAGIRAGGNLDLAADNGSVSFGGGAGQGVQSTGGNVNVTAATGISNSGTISADAGDLTLRSNGTISNSGTMHAAGVLDLADRNGGASENINNSGKLLGGTVNVKADGLTVTGGGVVEARGNLSLALNGLTVGGAGDAASKIVAATSGSGTANITTTSLLNNYGTIHSGGSLLINAPSLTNRAGGRISAGNNLTINASVGDLLNLGALFSDGTLNLRAIGGNLVLAGTGIRAVGNLSLISDNGTISIAAGEAVQSTNGNLSLTAATGVSNSGTVTADAGDLTLRSNGAVSNSGTFNAGGLLDLANKLGAALSSLVNTGNLRGGSMNVQADSLAVTGGGVVETTGNMNLVLGSLVVGGAGDSSSRIVAAKSGSGTATISVANDFTNYGAVHSGQNLTLTAPNITNTASGGISALDTLVLRALSGNLLNQGALYAGQHLIASATGTLTNDATLANPMGTIDSDGDMNFVASIFANYSQIKAASNITISAPTFLNQVVGGDTRVWSALSASVDTSRTPWESGSYSCGPLGGVDTCNDKYFKRSWYRAQSYSGGTPGHSPQIIGGGTVTIKDFNSGKNLGGLISGNTVTLVGNGGATFVNDALSLQREDFSFTYTLTDQFYAVCKLNGDCNDLNQWGGQSATTSILSTIHALSAGIRASTLNMGGFSLVNIGSPYSATPNSKSASGAGFSAPILNAPGIATVGFGGLTIVLPSNPNGLFIVSKNPQSNYLVESNPLFTSKSAVGSEYLLKLMGFSLDLLTKRLGDAGYETYLVRQQLIAQTGTNSLKGYGSETAQMQRLFEQGASQSKGLGLIMGRGLSASQQAGLKQDMVWMVETSVNGQKVLAPVVYLAASTRAMIETGGAVIAADKVNLNLASLSNTGGTIAGSSALNITSQGDIKNLSGTIKGGDVALVSTQGSVINQTQVVTTGDDSRRQTTVGKQAGILSSGTLSIAAAKDITILGGKIAAGGDAKLAAGGNVTFDTVEDKNASSFIGGKSSTRERTTEQIRSEFSSGGNLSVKAGNDITIAGSSVNAKGNAALDAGGDLNVVARDNTKQVVTTSEKEGWGVGGGLWGKEKNTIDAFQSRSVGSTITAGGDTNLSAGKTATIQGSAVNSTGSINIAAQDVQVLAARDIDRTTTVKESETILSISSGDVPKTNSLAKSSAKVPGQAKASASASATNDGGGLDFYKKNKTETFDEDTRAIASTLAAGKNLSITSRKDTTLEGAKVEAKGDVNLSGQNVNILAAQDTHVSTSKTSTTKVGLYFSSTNAADAKATAGNSATAVIGTADANAGSNAQANAASSTSIDVMRSKTTETKTVDVVNKGSSLASGGTLRINSAKTLTVQGSDVSGEQGVEVKAKDMAFIAAQDTHSSMTTTSSTSAGLYIDGNANAAASATAAANAGLGANAGAKAEATAKAKVSVGVQAKNVTTSDSEGSSTARVSTITSGAGSITRKAENSITDVGTAIDAAGDFSQSAKTITSRAAANTTYSSSDSTSNTAKIGVYAKAEAGVSADAGASAGLGGAKAGANVEAKASVGVGIQASYTRDSAASTTSSSDAVVSTIKAGGKVKSVSTDKTSLEGTTIKAGQGGVEIEAAALDFAAAKSTTSSTSSIGNVNASASIGVSRGTGKGVDVDLAGGTSKNDKSNSSSTASAGSIESAGNVVIKTKGDTRLEGTNIAATGDTTVIAGGNLVIDAARDTTSSNKTAFDVNASFSTTKSSAGDKSGVSGGVAGGFSKSTSESSTATAGSINSGGKLTLSAGKAVTLEGANLAAGGDATISAKDGVTMSAARSTSSSESYGARAGVEVGSGKESGADGNSKSKSGSATVEGNYSRAKESIAVAGSVQSGGNLKIVSNKDVTLEGTTLAATGKASVLAGGSVNYKAAESTSESQGFSASLSVKADKTDKTPAPAAKPATPAADPAKTKNPGTGGTQGADGTKQSAADLAKWQKNQGAAVQELKDKQNGAGTSANKGATSAKDAAATPNSGDGKKTPPPVPTAPKPERQGATPAAAPSDGKKTPPPVPTAPKPERKTPAAAGGAAPATPAADEAGPTTEKNTNVAAGGQFQMKNKTTQKAGSISAGAGGVEIVAAGGDVNLVGTNINSEGDANISAQRNVNISATKNTESSFGVAAAVSVDRKSEGPSKPGTDAAAPGAAGAKKTPPAVPTADKPNSPRANAQAAGKEAAAVAAAKQNASGSQKTPPPVPTAPKPERHGAAATPVPSDGKKTPPPVPTAPKPERQGAATPVPSDGKKTPPPVPTAPKPERQGAAVTPASSDGKKTPPPVPTALKPERQGAAATPVQSDGKKTPPPVPTAPKPVRPGQSAIGNKPAAASPVPAVPAVEEKDPNTFGGERSVYKTTNKDPDNKSDAFVGIGGGGSVKNQGATIKTGGKLNISSGGKTTLTNTVVQATEGENIAAQGGVERKTERDVSVLNASTNSGTAGANQMISKVPSGGNSATGVPATPGATAPTTDAAQGTSAAPQSTLKAAQGSGSGAGVKKP